MQVEKASQYNKMYRDAFVCCEIYCAACKLWFTGGWGIARFERKGRIIPTQS